MPRANLYGETEVLDDAARANVPGRFVRLADGVVHYELGGPAGGQPVVLMHGFSVPYYIWDPTYDALAGAGLRVLRYDLYGRGYSDRPRAVYDLGLFERQLLDLLTALGIEGPVDLAGVSLGGAIAVHVAARHAQRVRRLCLIDPAGFPLPGPPLARLLGAPLLAELIFAAAGNRLLVGGLHGDLKGPRLQEYVDRYRPPMRYRGFKRALVSTIRHTPLERLAPAYEQVSRQGTPVLLIWGREDRAIPFAVSEQVRKAIPQAEFHPIAGAGHIPHYEQPEVVNPLLVEFLQR